MRATAQHNNITAANRTPDVRGGFTLLELLVVMALTAVLLTLIFKPLIDTFNLTSRAGTQIEAQAAARDTMREVTTTLSDAAYIYDNSSNAINIWVPAISGSKQVAVPTVYAMAEYVRPSRQYDQGANLDSDPTTGDPVYSPSASAAKTGYSLPLTAGRTLGRLFIGLTNNTPTVDTSNSVANGKPIVYDGMPVVPYFNQYEEPRVSSKDNRYTLYRAEAQTFILDPNGAAGATVYIPNLKLFHTVDSAGKPDDTATGTIQLHDPNFFYDNLPAGGKEAGAGTAVWAVPGAKPTGNGGSVYTIADNWKAISSTVLLPKKVDAVALNRNTDTNSIIYYQPDSDVVDAAPVTGDVSHVRPLITFAPYYVENDPGTPASVENSGNEGLASAAVTYQTQYSHWDNPFRVQVFRTDPAKYDPTGDPLAQAALTYYEYDPATGKIMFNTAAPGAAPAGAGTVAGPIVDPTTGVWTGPGATPYRDSSFFAYSVDPLAGAVNFSFPWSVLCHDTAGNNYDPAPQKYSPQEINNTITGAAEKRYVLLGVLSTQMWGAPPTLLMPAVAQSPLDPAIFGPPAGSPAGTPARVAIVPGSERVFGPDQNPGPHYGYRTQYTRVSASAGVVGPNQYKINYTEVPNAASAAVGDPRVMAGYVEFDSGYDDSEGSPNMASVENTIPPTNTDTPNLSYRPHSLPQVKNVSNTNAPSDPIEITYRFQMNRPNDVVKADYLTRELMNVSINIRYYDPRSSRPQETNLTSQVKVRNLQR